MTEPLLNENWDLAVDAGGNIAMADADLSIAQAVANEIKLIRGESWIDPTQGLPMFTTILRAATPDLPLLQTLFKRAAMLVPGVIAAQATITLDPKTRVLSGIVAVTTDAGTLLDVTI